MVLQGFKNLFTDGFLSSKRTQGTRNLVIHACAGSAANGYASSIYPSTSGNSGTIINAHAAFALTWCIPILLPDKSVINSIKVGGTSAAGYQWYLYRRDTASNGTTLVTNSTYQSRVNLSANNETVDGKYYFYVACVLGPNNTAGEQVRYVEINYTIAEDTE